jgi:class 3 adenylate cyclase
MLIEDLEDHSADHLRPDLEKLLGQSNQLLSGLDDLVRFSRGGEAGLEDPAAGGESAMTRLIESMGHVEESNLKAETGQILVVDDIEANRDLLSRRLLRDGHRVTTAADGREALLLLEGEPFDLVLLDLMMPGMNGYEALRRMKSDPKMRNIPVIMVSALNETDSVVRCIEAGAHDYLFKPFDPILLKARIASGLESKQWSDEERSQRQFIRQAFSRFISPAVVDQLMSDPEKLSLGGERMDITCLFTDLAGFTTLIENNEPSVVLPVLNRYLDGLCRVFLQHDGTIDKIVGDALHGFFGAPVPQPDHACRALRCALDVDAYARSFIAEKDAAALGFGATRIGVHSGTAVVGNFGGDAFFDYTAHGDVVNTAARLEGANKYLGTTVCASGETKSRCREVAFRPVGQLLLKGKSKSLEVFEPLRAECAEPSEISGYVDAYRLMAAGDNAALEAFTVLAESYPDDPLAALHAGRLAQGKAGTLIVLDEK